MKYYRAEKNLRITEDREKTIILYHVILAAAQTGVLPNYPATHSAISS